MQRVQLQMPVQFEIIYHSSSLHILSFAISELNTQKSLSFKKAYNKLVYHYTLGKTE